MHNEEPFEWGVKFKTGPIHVNTQYNQVEVGFACMIFARVRSECNIVENTNQCTVRGETGDNETRERESV